MVGTHRHMVPRSPRGRNPCTLRVERVQGCPVEAGFIFPVTPPTSAKAMLFQQIPDFHFFASSKHTYFYLAFRTAFAFWKAILYKIKGREHSADATKI
jgi:hypothetical protein